jgi:hypothetical protein
MLETPHPAFLFCHGQNDSHALVLSKDGSPNPSPRAGQPYGGCTWPEILDLAAAPAAVGKGEAPAIIASTYREHDGRSHDVQRERGRYGLLVLDVDTGGPSIDAMRKALRAAVGDAEHLIYSTSSATPELPKWRAVVPLAEPVAGADWKETQGAFFDCIEAELGEGVEADRALDRTGQPFFLPNVPPARRGPDGQPLFYRWQHVQGQPLRLDSGPIAARLAERAEAAAEAERAMAERKKLRAVKTAARLASDTLSPIDAFNAKHTVAELLEKYGFENEPSGWGRGRGTDNWQSPYQRTGYGLRDFGDHWVSLSGADAAEGLGMPTKSGSGRYGDAFTLYAHFEHGGNVEAAVAAYGQALRAEMVAQGCGGRFVGPGAMATDKPAEAPEWLGVAEAAARIKEAVEGALGAVVEGQESPVVAVAASPGAGKSRVAREAIAARLAELPGDVAFYCPTLDLAEEAAEHFRELGVEAIVVRGREAARPDGGGPMCQRSGLVGLLKSAGLEVGANICKRKGVGGAEEVCPHRAGCPWVEQWHGLDGGPVVRCYSHAHLWLPDGSGRGEPALRVIDESCWGGALGQAEVPLAGWLGYRRCAPELAADIHKAALDMLPVLRSGEGLQALPYSPEDLRAYAAGEHSGGVIHAGPSATDEEIAAAARMRGDLDKGAGARAAVWRLLAEAKEAGRDRCERVVMAGEGLRVFWRKAMPEGPVVLLDADADAEILRALWPERAVEMVRAELRPVAEVVQCADKSFSKRALLGLDGAGGGEELRAELVGLVRLEALRQRAEGSGGLLVVASKAVVVRIFADAGLSAPRLGAELHGARWAWYGPATRGLNDWRGFGGVILVGREELPPDALAGQARALFGDGAEPLALPEPDGNGAVIAPAAPLPVLMADGSARALMGRAYAEPRLRALQMQHREHGLRQAAERLRLAHAPRPKRVLVLSRVPVPGLPVAELVTWAELAPSRLARAMAEAAHRSGILRTSAAGLAADAPETFPSVKAAERWLAKEGGEQIKYPPTPNKDSLGVGGYLIATPATARLLHQRGRRTPLLVLSDAPVSPQEARERAERALGPLAAFEALEAAPEPQKAAPAAHIQMAKPPAIRPESGVLGGESGLEGLEEAAQMAESVARLGAAVLRWQATPAGQRALAAHGAHWMAGRGVAAAPPR